MPASRVREPVTKKRRLEFLEFAAEAIERQIYGNVEALVNLRTCEDLILETRAMPDGD